MKPYKLVAEHSTHFEVDDGSGKPFKVAKTRLAHSTVERIRQHFSDGGEVQPDDQVAKTTDDVKASRDIFSLFRSDSPASGTAPMADDLGQTGVNASGAMSRMLGVQPTAGAAPDPASVPASQGVPEMLARPPDTAQPQTPGAAPAAPVLPSMRFGADPTAGQIAGASKAEQAATGQKGQAEAAGMADIAAKEQAAADNVEKMRQAGEAQLAQRMAHQDQIFQDVLSSRIDPNRFWNTRTTGQKISASIGLILGGIGSGLTGQPNYALGVIDKAIDRDMDAQKTDLGKKENLLGHYMQQTRDLQSAQHLARADYLTSVAAQVQAATAKMSSQTAIPAAQQAVAQIRAKAAQEEQLATERGLQIKQGQMNLSMGQQQMAALQEILKGVSGGGGFDRRVLEMPAFKDYRERAVDLPDGSIGFAADKEEADKTRESMATVSRLKSKLQRFQSMFENGSPRTLDRGLAQAQRADLLAEMGHLHGLNRLSDQDLAIFEKQIPDLTDAWPVNAGKKLSNLGKSIDDVVWSNNAAMLHRPGKRPNGR